MTRTPTQDNQTIWQRWRDGISDARVEIPFFWFLSLMLFAFIVGMWLFFPGPSLINKIIITPIMLLHIAMYWFNLALDMRIRREFLLYMGIQLILIVVVILLSQIIYFIPVLFMTLIGQTTGFVIPGRKKLITILILAFVMLLFFWWIEPSFLQHPAMMTLAFAAVIVFQLIFTSVYNQTAAAKYQAEDALEKLEIANLKIEHLTRSEERQRIARELHDTLAQGLTGIILQLDAVDHYLDKGETERAQQVVQHAMKAARDTLGESRLVIDDLRHADHRQTLGEKLESMCRDPEMKIHLTCILPQVLSAKEEELIERLVGESLTNIRKHADAESAQVNISYDAENLYILISDDGKGFDPQGCLRKSGHYGLIGMQERLHAVSGEMTIESQPGQGCRINMQFPREQGDLP